MPSRKRPRAADDSGSGPRAECPYTAKLFFRKEQKGKKRRKGPVWAEEKGNYRKIMPQLSPFAPTGKFKTHETMDTRYYLVDATEREFGEREYVDQKAAESWFNMTRYNSFVRMLSSPSAPFAARAC